MYTQIINLANKYYPETVQLRRDFHRNPEIGWLEMRTSCIISEYLEELGYQVMTGRDVICHKSRMGLPSNSAFEEHYQSLKDSGFSSKYLELVKDGFTGVVATLECGQGPTVAMRFDIDALGVNEDCSLSHFPYSNGFQSSSENIMHACGHDGHIAIGLTTAKIIMNIKEQLHGTIKLIFQPAEEGVRGAKSMVKKGILDDVDYLYAAHIFPRTDNDKNADCYGGMNESFATTKLDVTYHGVSTHAAETPQFGRNAILSAAACITNLHSIPRNSNGCTRINVGTIHAGTGRNVVAESAKLEIEVRGASTELNRYMEVYARDVIQGAAIMHDTHVEVEEMGKAYALSSDESFIQHILDISNQHLGGIEFSEHMYSPLGASDDFSYMMYYVQVHGGKSTYLKLISDGIATLHSTNYDYDEIILKKGAIIFSSIAYSLLNK
ncbi:amidohydrolase [Tannockella kyphosi]|uniref:amidohydrolase n=1 Tax=Tannockella kyphosi TaxID=2899121 RepID=UPI0020128C34|nr:amidohydrolase [Tannockella kyphosi]